MEILSLKCLKRLYFKSKACWYINPKCFHFLVYLCVWRQNVGMCWHYLSCWRPSWSIFVKYSTEITFYTIFLWDFAASYLSSSKVTLQTPYFYHTEFWFSLISHIYNIPRCISTQVVKCLLQCWWIGSL